MVHRRFNFSLLDQLTFYGSYHHKAGNQAIHFVFVPLIMWSAGVWLAYVPAVTSQGLSQYFSFLPDSLASGAEVNWTLIFMAAYSVYYTILEPFAGASWAVCLGMPMWLTGTAFQQHIPHAWAWAVGVHVLSWFVQVYVGHILIEHRKPALLDSFFQSLVLANLFAWMEALFALGYRPKLHAELQRQIEEELARNNLPGPPGATRPLLDSAIVSGGGAH